jgi:opacity protein-like surface antigen
MKVFLLAAAALAAAAPASAQEARPTVSIALGETVTVRVAGNGFVELSRARGDAEGARAENTIRFTFTTLNNMLMLKTENGYGQAFDYRARMIQGRRSADTSICTVLPRVMTFETWQDPIERLELREPRLSENGEGGCR